jgi:hypothetical protein
VTTEANLDGTAFMIRWQAPDIRFAVTGQTVFSPLDPMRDIRKRRRR